MRREWRAAGRDVTQVQEGAETARGESERRGRCAEEVRVQPERGVGLWGVARTVCGRNAGAAREGSGAVRSGVGGVRK